ncbi:MAG: ComEC/Rec2 family competence protein [Elusimicrobiota bacterium]
MPLSWLRRPLVLAALLAVGGLSLAGALGRLRPPRAPELERFLRAERVCLRVLPRSGFAPKRDGERSWLELRAAAPSCAAAPARWIPLRAPVRALAVLPAGDPASAALLPGREALLEGRLRRPRRAANPGEFDEGEFLASRGAAYMFRGRVRDPGAGTPPLALPRAAAAAAHRLLHRRLERRLPPLEAAVLEGLLLGYKGALPPARGREVQDAGVLHLLVPSGAKVGAVLAAVLGLGALFGLPRGARLCAAAAAAGFYTLVVGADAPYTRAWLGFAAFAAGWTLRRESGALQALALAALATFLVEPQEALTAGFRMAYAAVFFIALYALRPRPAERPSAWTRARRALAAGATIQAALWPTFGAYFGRGSLVGLPANLLLIPCAPALMGAGLLAALVPDAWAGPFAALAGALARAFLGVCAVFAAAPFAAVDLAPMGGAATLAWYLALFAALALSRPAAAAAALAAAFLLAWPFAPERAPLEVLLLSQPGGRAALLRLPDGRSVLLDARVRPSLLRGVLRAQGLARVDELWLRGDAGLGRRPAGILSLAGGLRRLRARSAFAQAGAALRLGAAAGGEPPALELRHGALELRLDEDWARVRVLRGGGGDYCIMLASSGFPSSRCAAGRTLSLRRDGAVLIRSDGIDVRVETTRT